MYVTILWVLVERVKKHDLVLNISRIFSASHFVHVLFLHEPQGIRAGKNVSKDTYQSKFFWSQQVLIEACVKPNAVLGTLDIAKEAYPLILCVCVCVFKLKPNGSSNSALFLIRCLPCWRVSLNVYIFCYVLLILNFASSYVAVIRSQWKNGTRNEILWWLEGLWLQLVQRVICNLNIYSFFYFKTL